MTRSSTNASKIYTSDKAESFPELPIQNVYDCAFNPSPDLDSLLPWKASEKRDMIAVTDGLTGVQYTFREVAARSSYVAYNLVNEYNLSYGDRVLICMPTSLDLVFIVLACQKLGLQMACCNDAFTSFELQHCVKIVKPAKILTLGNAALLLSSLSEETSKKIISAESSSLLWSEVAQAPERTVDDVQETCLLAFTSGTSGLPKLAMIPLDGFNRSLINLIVSSTMFTSKEEQLRLVLCLPIFHGTGLMQMIVGLMTGVHTIFCINRPFNMQSFLQTSAKYKVQLLGLVPALANGLLMCGPMAQAALSHVQFIGIGASPLGPDLEKRLRAAFPKCTFLTAYGLTECISPATLSTTEDPLRITGSVGRVSPGCQIMLIDDEGMPVSEGQYGEVLIKHVTMTKGYFENEAASKELIDENGWLHSGDIGYMAANQNLFIVDRKKDLIKYNAMQIAPAEIEDLLLSHPQVREAGVIGVPDTVKKGEQVPRAYVVLKDPTQTDVKSSILDYVAQNLSHYKHLRGGVRVLEFLPRNGSGKLLRTKLREMAQAENAS